MEIIFLFITVSTVQSQSCLTDASLHGSLEKKTARRQKRVRKRGKQWRVRRPSANEWGQIHLDPEAQVAPVHVVWGSSIITDLIKEPKTNSMTFQKVCLRGGQRCLEGRFPTQNKGLKDHSATTGRYDTLYQI